jgi:DNA polymerase-1
LIQETNASILKIALINLSKRIKTDNLPVKLHLPIHDEILASCPKYFAEEYLEIQEEEMVAAANLFVEEGLLGVDSKILDKWTK